MTLLNRKEIINHVLDGLGKGLPLNKCCQNAGVGYMTFYSWRNKDKELNEKVLDALDSRIQNVEDALYRDALKGNTTAQIFFLKNRSNTRWKDQIEKHHTGEGNKTIIYVSNRVGENTKQILSTQGSADDSAIERKNQISDSR